MAQLDALRGVAILLVLFEHYAGALAEHFPIGAGTLGVGLFFTLSAFLITGVLLEDMEAQGGRWGRVLKSFYIRRVFRLAPAYYAVLLALALLGIAGIARSWPWHAAYLSNVYVLFGGASTVFWSLAVEEQFYLLWPMLLIVTPRKYLIHVAIGMMALAVALKIGFEAADQRLDFRLLFAQLEPLGFGCVLALLCWRGGRANQFDWLTARRARVLSAAAGACLLVALAIWFSGGQALRAMFNNLLCAIFYGWAVLFAARGFHGVLGKALTFAPLTYIGRISYGVYLTHTFTPDILEKFAGPLPKIVAGPIVLAMTFGLCALSWRYFEQPLMKLGRRLSQDRARAETLRAEEAARL